MSQSISIGNMIIRISGLGAREISDWEFQFIHSIVEKYNARDKTKALELTEKQIEVIEHIYNKHFHG
jgi:hypothetical protein